MHKKKKTTVRRIVTGRIVSVLPAVVLQGLIIYGIARWLAPFATLFYSVLSVLSALFVLILISKRGEGAYKMLWLLVMFVAPLPGAVMYLFYGNKRTGKILEQRLNAVCDSLPAILNDDVKIQQQLEKEDKRVAQTFAYIKRITGFPVLRNDTAQYYPVGELLFEQMMSALKEAKRYVFIEYFIIQEGVMWETMVDVMEQKVQEGVDIRVLYDDIGSIGTFSHRNRLSLLKKGIKCEKFNPLIVLSGALNNRDHRKIMVVDGIVAFSGGINLADEYINEEHPFGHWKDIGFKITGDAIRSYVYMFMEFWNASSLNKVTDEIIGKDYVSASAFDDIALDGYVLPYYDSPNREEAASNNLFIDLLGQSVNYIWFYTPYLLLGDGLRDAFVRAAQRGVDVRIVMPGIPDKKIVYRMSRSYYRELLEAGVKIYEYTPGFVHAKACLVDDCIGSIGTVNLDYRSLYLHYECNALFYKASILDDLKKDFETSMEVSRERTLQEEKKGLLHRIINGILRIFAPLV
ncbi:MAG: cardiolipin synthase [Lachnospiraceae bacterium]|nr:cardiolipin synthase [Lachnospiraceae bacterium]MDE7274203.1 cardiolipin synthase [Lachnospiraceae bacterium]